MVKQLEQLSRTKSFDDKSVAFIIIDVVAEK